MDISKNFGAFLSVIGIFFLIYSAFTIVGEGYDITRVIVFGVLGCIFFFSGISLLQKTPPGKK